LGIIHQIASGGKAKPSWDDERKCFVQRSKESRTCHLYDCCDRSLERHPERGSPLNLSNCRLLVDYLRTVLDT
jgi:hypothetical protein